ncbi:hypothetical protein FGO68_gene7957 [Halteria grandinella]|uniref:Uncharacterized protein n=1 Tax=Halteria grandinella TaxID=5974 RepID=A0A8J8P8J9_HALGN|nr:hypothetical protein FGO68_gene7957 [Halteria grandinella]
MKSLYQSLIYSLFNLCSLRVSEMYGAQPYPYSSGNSFGNQTVLQGSVIPPYQYGWQNHQHLQIQDQNVKQRDISPIEFALQHNKIRENQKAQQQRVSKTEMKPIIAPSPNDEPWEALYKQRLYNQMLTQMDRNEGLKNMQLMNNPRIRQELLNGGGPTQLPNLTGTSLSPPIGIRNIPS